MESIHLLNVQSTVTKITLDPPPLEYMISDEVSRNASYKKKVTNEM